MEDIGSLRRENRFWVGILVTPAATATARFDNKPLWGRMNIKMTSHGLIVHKNVPYSIDMEKAVTKQIDKKAKKNKNK